MMAGQEYLYPLKDICLPTDMIGYILLISMLIFHALFVLVAYNAIKLDKAVTKYSMNTTDIPTSTNQNNNNNNNSSTSQDNMSIELTANIKTLVNEAGDTKNELTNHNENVLDNTGKTMGNFSTSMEILIETLSNQFGDAIENDDEIDHFDSTNQNQTDIFRLSQLYSYQLNAVESNILKQWLTLIKLTRIVFLFVFIKMVLRYVLMFSQIIISIDWSSNNNYNNNNNNDNNTWPLMIATSGIYISLGTSIDEFYIILVLFAYYAKFSRFNDIIGILFAKDATREQGASPFKCLKCFNKSNNNNDDDGNNGNNSDKKHGDSFKLLKIYSILFFIFIIIVLIGIYIAVKLIETSVIDFLLIIFYIIIGFLGALFLRRMAKDVIYYSPQSSNSEDTRNGNGKTQLQLHCDEKYWKHVESIHIVSTSCWCISALFPIILFFCLYDVMDYNYLCTNQDLKDVFVNVDAQNVWYLFGWIII